jgi:hypothetical protein
MYTPYAGVAGLLLHINRKYTMRTLKTGLNSGASEPLYFRWSYPEPEAYNCILYQLLRISKATY